MMYAEVALDRPVFQSFTYHVPPHLVEILQPGQLVKVPFRTAHESALVLELSDAEPGFTTKPIFDQLDPRPVLTPVQLALGRWIAENTRAPLGPCLWLMLPPGLARKSGRRYTLLNSDFQGENPQQRQIISILTRRGPRTDRHLKQAIKKSGWKKALSNLVDRSVIKDEPVLLPPSVRPKTARTAQLSIPPAEIEAHLTQLGRESRRANVLEVLWRHPQRRMLIPDTLDAAGCSRSVIKALEADGAVAISPEDKTVELLLDDDTVRERIIDLRNAGPFLSILTYLAEADGAIYIADVRERLGIETRHLEQLNDDGLITLGESEVWRDSVASRERGSYFTPDLTPDQVDAWDRIRSHMQSPDPDHEAFLLHGVTGSGKTEIYMQAVAHALSQGRQAIVMVPEIGLTAQMVQRFAGRFPGQVALVHSSLSVGERYDTWRRARDGQVTVVIGARSALFTPCPDVGLIILDEEHDDSYKQSPPIPPPYYHARETAVEYMRLNAGTVILGSATPDVISYHKAEAGRYTLLHLPDRILAHRETIEEQAQHLQLDDAQYHLLNGSDAVYSLLPPVKVVDMRHELRAGHSSVFSRALIASLHQVLDARQQAILFLNRRGSATYVFCRECGYIATCSRCDTTLTYHENYRQTDRVLVCHRCNHRQPNPTTCPECGSHRIKYFGRGTAQIEKTLAEEFPQARVLRWDQDTASRRGAHEEIYETFAERRADILVGTQMIAKGLDLPLVTLVGIISGDTALGLPDYRANESTFQLLAQVAGRAGRGLLDGQVILQTYQPDHYAITAAANHDYQNFYEQEIYYRRQMDYPPFTRLARLVFRNRVESEARRDAEAMANRLEKYINTGKFPDAALIGPAPCFFARIDGDYRWHLLLRCSDPPAFFENFETSHTIDIDPVNIL